MSEKIYGEITSLEAECCSRLQCTLLRVLTWKGNIPTCLVQSDIDNHRTQAIAEEDYASRIPEGCPKGFSGRS